jgi:hypothetical protein
MSCELWSVAQSLAEDSEITDLELSIAIEHIDRNLQAAKNSGTWTSLDMVRLKRVLELAVQCRHCEPKAPR